MIIITCGILISISIYLLLEPMLLRKVFGLILLGSAVNMIILICGRLNQIKPAFINDAYSWSEFANPLPQALILTAIVIGFGLLAFLCAALKALFTSQRKQSR